MNAYLITLIHAGGRDERYILSVTPNRAVQTAMHMMPERTGNIAVICKPVARNLLEPQCAA